MKKKYILNTNEQCPTCKKGLLIQKFHLETHPSKEPVKYGGGPRHVHRTVESEGGLFCNNPQCGQCFVRPAIHQQKIERILQILRTTIILVGVDTKTMFPEIILDHIIPTTVSKEFPKMDILEMLGNAMGKEIGKTPDKKLHAFFEILSEMEKQTLNLRFETLKEEFDRHNKSIQLDKQERLKQLHLKKPIVIPKGTQVEIVNTGVLSDHNTYIPIKILTGVLKNTTHFISRDPKLVYDNDSEILNLKKFWPKNIIFE